MLRTEGANCLRSLPHLAIPEDFELLLKTLAIVRLGVGINGNLSLCSILYALVELLHYRLDGVVETRIPVKGTPLCCG